MTRLLHILMAGLGFLWLNSTLMLAQNPAERDTATSEKKEQLQEVTVEGRQRGTLIPRTTAVKTEVISSAGLVKLACCNLSESFENSATITVGYTDAVSGAKQIQMLGLSGIYSQLLDENVPALRGLASIYGWSYVPGPWLEAIYISKGASSVINGYESITGQIDMEFKKPNAGNALVVNLYGNDALRMEANVTGSVRVSDKWSTGLLLHASAEDHEHDGNHDGFLDQPRSQLFHLYHRWFYINPNGLESRFGAKLLYEKRRGGQLTGFTNPFRSQIENRHLNLYNKTGFSIGDRSGQSIGIINSLTHHGQTSYVGLKSYDGKQNSWYSNLLFSSYFGNTMHLYTAGLSFMYDSYRTGFNDRLHNASDIRLDRDEATPGAFMQYTWTPSPQLTAIVGLRTDYNSGYGWLWTPRANLRYVPTEAVLLRASAGRGYHSPNIIAENIGMMASSRRFDLSEADRIGIEEAWNYGANATFYIPSWNENNIILSVEYFRTNFKHQAVADMERDPNSVIFYGLRGSSFANAWQADLSLTPFQRFDVFVAFRYNETQTTIGDDREQHTLEEPLNLRYRGLLNLSYATRLKKWVFDVTAQINGPSRLPSMTGYSTVTGESPAFPMFFAQITRNSKRFDIYAGVENLADYTQAHPVIHPEDPFGAAFDASQVWGPLMGRKIYLGIRLRIGEL